MADLIDKDGPYDPHDTTFAVGHYFEDRVVWFDFLTATVDDIMREGAIPPEERENVKKRNKLSAQRFKEFYRGPLNGSVPLLSEQAIPPHLYWPASDADLYLLGSALRHGVWERIFYH